MRRFWLCLLSLLVLPRAAASQTVTLAWDPNPATDNVTSYVVSYGTTSKVYTTTTDVGNVTQWTSPTLTPGTYYFVVQAKNALATSPFSTEVTNDCIGPLGLHAVSIFVTKLTQSTPNVGTKATLYFQLGSPNAPIVSETIAVDGSVVSKQFGPAGQTDLTNDGGMWFPTPLVAGTHPVSFTATNAVGCTAIATKDALSNPLVVTVK